MANRKLVLFADATCDIPIEYIKKNDIGIIGLRYTINDVDGWCVGNTQKEIDDYYWLMRKGAYGKTSFVTYNDAQEALEPYFRKKDCDIICLTLSSGLAQGWHNINMAGTDLATKYGCKFYAPDTRCVSGMSYIIMKQLVEYRKQGKDFDYIKQHTPDIFKDLHAYFTVESLTYLHKGGRLSAAGKIIGGLLNVKPIITVDKEGKLVNVAKVTGRAKSMQWIADKTAGADITQEMIVVHANSPDDAEILKKKVLEINPTAHIEIGNIGFIIGTHTGPGTVGMCFKKTRKSVDKI